MGPALIARFRFYEELNDFLAPARRRREFEWTCPDGATVKHAVEALGVPHTELELLRVRELHERFATCTGCDRVYWEGGHWRRMRALLADLNQASPDGAS